MESNENQIIAECQSGNWDNFGQVYDQYLPKIYQFVYYRVRHKQIAEDLTATVFLKVVQKIGTYSQGKSPFIAWIYTIARNTVIDHTRTSKPTSDLEQAYNLASKDDVEDFADKAVKSEIFQKALKQLTPVQQEIIMLRIWDGLSHKEIAQIMNISEGNSKTTFFRAVAAIKQLVPVSVYLAIILTNPSI